MHGQYERRLGVRDTREVYVYLLYKTFLMRTYRATLQAKLHSCENILSRTSAFLFTLGELKKEYFEVAGQAAAFEAECDALIQEEVKSPFISTYIRND